MNVGDSGRLRSMQAKDLEGKFARIIDAFKPGDVLPLGAAGSFICTDFGFKVQVETGDIIAIWQSQIRQV